jgi:protein-tyrosine phosphatase
MSDGVLFVCLGNICRSPLVEAVARAEFERARLEVPVASCGTGSWHVGEGADPRMVAAGASAGYDLGGHRARQLHIDDYRRFSWVLAMDEDNLEVIEQRRPRDASARLSLFLPAAGIEVPRIVPDPYFGGAQGFADVVALAQRGVAGLIERLRADAG